MNQLGETGEQDVVCGEWLPLFSRRSSRLSNGETESVKTMIVHDEGESDAGSTPCKDSTLIVRQVAPPAGGPLARILAFSIVCSFILPPPPSVSIPFFFCVDVIFLAMDSSSAQSDCA